MKDARALYKALYKRKPSVMKKPKDEPDKKPRKRKENYDEKLKIKGSLFDVLKVAVTPKPDENEKADK